MENVNGVSSTSSISPEPCSKAPLAKGLRNFRMDKESATKGQLSLLRYFRSEPRKSGKSSDKVPEQLKTEESSPTDDTDAATVSVHHKVSVDVEKPSVKVEKKKPYFSYNYTSEQAIFYNLISSHCCRISVGHSKKQFTSIQYG